MELVVDFDRHQITNGDTEIFLSSKEWQLFDYFAANPGRTIFHEELLVTAWGQEARDDVQSLRVWINRLRQKIERNPAQPRLLRTVQGVGYIFNAVWNRAHNPTVDRHLGTQMAACPKLENVKTVGHSGVADSTF